ncbi:MAG: ATP-binding protein [Planctomycetota bacterium]
MFKNSLFRKLIFTYVVLIIISLGLISLVAIEIFSQSYREEVRQHLENTAYAVRSVINDCKTDVNLLNSRVTKLGNDIHTRITIIDKSGNVLADSERDHSTLENHNDRPEVLIARAGGVGQNIRYSHTLAIDMLYVAIPLDPARPGDTIIRAALPLKQVSLVTNRVYSTVGITFLVSFLFAVLMGLWLVSRIVRPVREMVSAAESIAKGDFSRQIAVTSGDEIGALANSINTMNKELQHRFAEINHEKAKLATILSRVREGIIAIGKTEKVIFANKTAGEMLDFDTDYAPGKYLWEAVRNDRFVQFVKECLANPDRNPIDADIADLVSPRQFRIYCMPVKSGVSDSNSFIIVIRDITESAKYEQLRRDFVANASHELRTPLSLVKGYVETLKDSTENDPHKTQEFIDIIEKNVNQLNNLVQDMLELSRLEYQKGIGQIKPVNIRDIINPVLADFRPAVALKKQAIDENIQPDIPVIHTEPELLRKAIANLVDNAVKYTPEGGRIEIAAKSDGNSVTIAVKDNGIGIPVEDQPRVFERFYRVDKSRSREMGGTGLGLSIVKHIIQTLNGEVSLKSEANKGSIFTVTLPLGKGND